MLTYTAALIRQGVHEALNGARIVYGTEGPCGLPAHAITRVGQCAEKRGYCGTVVDGAKGPCGLFARAVILIGQCR